LPPIERKRKLPQTDIGKITPIAIEEELKGSYLDYAMSVIVSRALPDIRDGLKPVQRRLLYALNQLGLKPNTPYKKSARVVGEVLGKYHPHGDDPVYEAMVRMAQDFSMRYILVDGQGNFGSVDDDPPAAMRYTEVRLAPIAVELLSDIEKGTVDFVPNFDASTTEPVVLPSRLPNLLINGSSGIAVGMTTNIPPHNLNEVMDAIALLIDNPQASLEEIMERIKGPDFPTAGLILGNEGIKSAYATGRGKVVLQAKAHIEELPKGRKRIIVTELPYQTNKSALVERIAQLVKDKRVEGIGEVRDESDRHGIRLIMELKREVKAEAILNQLYKHTPLRTAFFVNMLALVDGQPRLLSLKEILHHYIRFREEVITRRCQFELKRAQERAHILEGLKIALDNLDKVITIIRSSADTETAQKELMKGFSLSSSQAQAILEIPLKRLPRLEREKVVEEFTQVIKDIAYLEDLLLSPQKILHLVRQEAMELKQRYGDGRRTQIVEEVSEIEEEEEVRQVIFCLTPRGYLKKVSLELLRPKMALGEASLFTLGNSHDLLLLFSRGGKAFVIKASELNTENPRSAKGIHLSNLLPLDYQEITALFSLPKMEKGGLLILVTAQGEMKRMPLGELSSLRRSGVMVIDLKGRDELITAQVAGEGDEVILVSHQGKARRLPLNSLPLSQRRGRGVKVFNLDGDDKVVGMDVTSPDGYLLLITEAGYGKLTPVSQFPLQPRAKRGVRAFPLSPKTGQIGATEVVNSWEEIILLSSQGNTFRMEVKDIPLQDKERRGKRIVNLEAGERIISVAHFPKQES
jgi:DNA gyrase subunit A